jgi:transcriptional regulator of aromatic amino acid metabolism
MYRRFKSDQKIASDVRIICSTTKNLEYLVAKKKFYGPLYHELHKGALVMPVFTQVNQDDFFEVIDGFSQQILQQEEMQGDLFLSTQEKKQIIDANLTSLHGIKAKVHACLVKKSKYSMNGVLRVQPAMATETPLADIAAMGRSALKDPQLMKLLWNKFRNQTQIASFLSVSKSSVNRRCKEFGLSK